ncbi:MAG TPA: hypothetical protein VJQ25_02965 [Nitrospira sp.]|nr:hypothetical protein [Nitrospira sp.]
MKHVRIYKRELEPATTALAAWIQTLRFGLLSTRLGMVKGVIAPLAQGVYYDREALIDDHAVWDVTGDGAGEQRVKRMKPYLRGGEVVGEEVVLKDSQKFQKALRDMMQEEITIEIPFLFTEQDVKDSDKNINKENKNPPVVDFGALLCLYEGSARVVDAEQQ